MEKQVENIIIALDLYVQPKTKRQRRIVMEFDKNGRHRLRIGEQVGKWTSYMVNSELEIDGLIYMGFTQAWDENEKVIIGREYSVAIKQVKR